MGTLNLKDILQQTDKKGKRAPIQSYTAFSDYKPSKGGFGIGGGGSNRFREGPNNRSMLNFKNQEYDYDEVNHFILKMRDKSMELIKHDNSMLR